MVSTDLIANMAGSNAFHTSLCGDTYDDSRVFWSVQRGARGLGVKGSVSSNMTNSSNSPPNGGFRCPHPAAASDADLRGTTAGETVRMLRPLAEPASRPAAADRAVRAAPFESAKARVPVQTIRPSPWAPGSAARVGSQHRLGIPGLTGVRRATCSGETLEPLGDHVKRAFVVGPHQAVHVRTLILSVACVVGAILTQPSAYGHRQRVG